MAKPVVAPYTDTTHRTKAICFVLLFCVSSLTTFYGVRIALPAVTNYGRGALIVLPAILIYGMPLFCTIMFYIYNRIGSVAKRWKIMHVTGATMLLLATFSLIICSMLINLEFGGAWIFGGASPIFPLDVMVLDIIGMLVGFSVLLVCLLNRSKKKSSDVLFRSSTARHLVMMAFGFGFSQYFLGEFFFGAHYLFELPYIDKNWFFVLAVYLCFPLLAFEGCLYLQYWHRKSLDPKASLLRPAIIILSTSFVLFLIILIGLIVNPYLFSESLQWEFEIGYAAKMPAGLFVIALWIIIPCLVALIRYVKEMRRSVKGGKETPDEPEQEAL